MTKKTTPGSGRPRGAPAGNKNAMRHGFYSKVKPLPMDDISPEFLADTSLNQEIAMLRQSISRLFEYSRSEDCTAVDAAHTLAALASASARLANLLRTAKYLLGDQSEVGQALHEALKELNAEGFIPHRG